MYEVNNLISSEFLTKSRGFIAYTTMKPPIDIDFQLLCVEVFVKNGNSQYVSISKAFYEENGVVFCNSRFYSKNKPATNHEDYHDEVNDMDRLESKSFEVPDDFKDALTYELMAIPMTLPSGHTIDQSTLEKCLATDASCCRCSCDPFTGLRYTGNRKPVLNVALKTRIDMFLLRNSHLPEVNGIKRTLGTVKDHNLISNSFKVDVTERSYSDISQISKKVKFDCDNSNARVKDHNLVSNSLKVDVIERSYSDISQISKKIKFDCDNSNASISLDDAIRSALKFAH
ncbi:hypothetical protein Trydic_g18044 [Trypoxylus dichotomus]